MAAKTPELDIRVIQGRNKIINGDMSIDQRAEGAVSTLTNGVYNLDRWAGQKSNTGVVTVQRVTDSLPPSFAYAMKFTVTTADASVAATDYDGFHQYIEGLNCIDLDFGKSTAKDITLSFWVRSSKTGTYTGSVANDASNRSRTFEYTINAANTWEYKTITMPGDVSGVWLINNGRGLKLFFSLMCGTNWQQAAGSWGSGNVVGTSNQVNWLDTLGATFYITGVQLEVGNQATAFEHKSITESLSACRRYYEKTYPVGQPIATVSTNQLLYSHNVGSSPGAIIGTWFYKVAKRNSPSFTFYNHVTSGTGTWRSTGGGTYTMSLINNYENFASYQPTTGVTAGEALIGHAVADSELA
jgi:hypothetical protein